MFIHMCVQHELRQATVKPRHCAAQHDKARTREFRRRFKIQTACGGQVIVFLGARNFRRRSPAVDFHIIRLIRAIGNIVMGQVGQAGQRICQCLIQFLGTGVHFCDFGLFLGHQCTQAFKFRLITAALGGAHLFAGFILFSLRSFGSKDCGTTITVNFQ